MAAVGKHRQFVEEIRESISQLGRDVDALPRDFYGRQLWDWKFSADVDRMTARVMGGYVEMCAWTLARAHARSGDRVAIAAYLGGGDVFDRAIADFAESYADQSERDYDRISS